VRTYDYIFVQVDVATKVKFAFQVKLHNIGISIVNRKPEEIVYCTVRDFECTYRDSNLYQTFGVVAKWIQVCLPDSWAAVNVVRIDMNID
jgi:vacuolar protein sorting-associated protein 13A/C